MIKNGALLPTPFLTVTLNSSGERGLLGVAFDPNFASNQLVYIYYTATTPTIHNRISRFTASGDVALAGSETIVMDLPNLSTATNHNGGALHFGPDGQPPSTSTKTFGTFASSRVKCATWEHDKMTYLKLLPSLTILLTLLNVSITAQAQSRNLLQNPNADQGVALWRTFGDASVETTPNGDSCFVVRNGGYFLQDVKLPDDATGQYAVLVGRGSSERIERDGVITGLPYLYGYMMEQGPPNGGRILAYLQGQQMLARPNMRDVWVNMSGIFKVPENTKRIRFFINQAEREGVPHNGSAARFDNLGLYLFATKEEAEAFLLSQ